MRRFLKTLLHWSRHLIQIMFIGQPLWNFRQTLVVCDQMSNMRWTYFYCNHWLVWRCICTITKKQGTNLEYSFHLHKFSWKHSEHSALCYPSYVCPCVLVFDIQGWNGPFVRPLPPYFKKSLYEKLLQILKFPNKICWGIVFLHFKLLWKL